MKIPDTINTKYTQRIVLGLFVAIIITVCVLNYIKIRDNAICNEQEELKTICSIKEQQIEKQLSDYFNEIKNISYSRPFSNAIKIFNKHTDKSSYMEGLEVLKWLKLNRNYENFILFNINGDMVFSADSRPFLYTAPQVEEGVKMALVSRTQQANLIWIPELSKHLLQLIVPIVEPSTNIRVGVLVVQINPDITFAKYATAWSTTTKTAEILIAKFEGDSAFSLTNPQGISTSKRFCLTNGNDPKNPFIVARSRGSNHIRGIDYRGNEVIAYVKPLSEKDWYIEAKIDYMELVQNMRNDYINNSLIIVLFSLVTIFSLLIAFMQHDKKHLKQAIAAEKQHNQTLLLYKLIFQNLNEGVILTGDKDKIIYINSTACHITGYNSNEAEGEYSDTIFNFICCVDDSIYKCIKFKNRNNEEFFISLSEIPCIDNDGQNKCKIIVLRDITTFIYQQKELDNSNSLYISMFEYNPQPMIVYDLQTCSLMQMNKAAYKLLKYSDKEPLEISVFNIIHQCEFERFRDIKPQLAHGEWKILTKTGETIIVDVSGHDIFRNGKPCRHLMAIDVTQKTISQEKLRISENRYRTLIESLPDALILHKNLKIIYVNNISVVLLRAKEPAEIIGKSVLDLFPFENPQDIISREESIQQNKNATLPIEHKLLCLDGSTVLVETIARYYGSEDEFGSQIIIHDLTLQKKAQETFINSEKRYRSLVEASPDSIIIHKNYIIQFVNKAACTLFGYNTYEDIIGQNILDFFHPNDYKEIQKRLDQVKSTRQAAHFAELTMKNHQGALFIVETINTFLSIENEELKTQLIIRDITQRKKMETELVDALHKAEESDKLKSSFLANFSHEIRTPLNSIVGFSDMLLCSSNINDFYRNEYLSIIQKSSFRLLNVITDTIEISKIDSGVTEIYNTSINLNNLMNELYSQYSLSIFNNKGLSFELITPPDDDNLEFISDKNKLTRILNNLLSNSMHYTDKGGVLFYANVNSSHITFGVKDSGIGISAENQKLIFKRFHRIDNPTTTGEGGIGLGLSIAQAYAQILGGEITFSSEIDKGSEFMLTIPYTKATENHSTKSDSAPNRSITRANKTLPRKDTNKEKIVLIAEDEDSNFRLLHELIEPLKCTIIRAKDGLEAVSHAQMNSNIGLILMDIKMPMMNGYDAFTSIRKFNTQVPIVAQTAYCTPEDINRINNFGFDDLITKPINHDRLMQIINKYIE